MKKRPGGRFVFSTIKRRTADDHAALSHIAVSNALLINGMFMPKLLFVALFAAALAGLSATLWATSVARSHDPCSWERATEKNRNT
jgi:hypothetical protein